MQPFEFNTSDDISRYLSTYKDEEELLKFKLLCLQYYCKKHTALFEKYITDHIGKRDSSSMATQIKNYVINKLKEHKKTKSQ